MKKTIFLFFLFLILPMQSVLASDVVCLNFVSNYANAPYLNGFLAIVPNILLISLIIPVVIYFKYGKKSKFDFNQDFDSRIPTDDSPIFVDAFYSTVTEVGDISRYGVEATLMDLIRRGYVKIDVRNEEVLLLLNKKDANLDNHEKALIDALAVFEEDGKVSFSKKSKKTKEKFASKVNKFELDYQKKHKNDMELLFKSKGNTYIKIYAGIVGFLAFVFFILADNSSISSARDAYFISFITLVICFLLFLFPNTFGGKWTKNGLENFNKWKLFKKHACGGNIPVDNWKEYLIYATALGCYDNIVENLDDFNDDLMIYCKLGGAKGFSNIMDSISAVNVNVIGSKGRKKKG